MDLRYSDEQEMLRETARKFIATECGSQKVRALMESETAHDPRQWRAMADQGWTALLLPEAYGG
ncbi:MAG: acyl-CoA dehydrogenase family protein, partial [Candidatus Methylomirabilis sp.]|nr:acyl-CoA dehydrogenase family protein [Deltaproteobacteria bacterium]